MRLPGSGGAAAEDPKGARTMTLVALACLAASACQPAPAPHDRTVQAILGLRYGTPDGSTQDELVAALAVAGASLECSGDVSENEVGVYERGCMGTVPLAGCPSSIAATFVRNSYADGIPHLVYVRIEAPDLGDCGPRGEAEAAPPRWPHAAPAPVESTLPPWASTLTAQLERDLGKPVIDGADHSWRTDRLEVVVHDARLARCTVLEPCRSYAEIMASRADPPARGASR